MTELSRISRTGVDREGGMGGGFMRCSVVGVEVGVSCCCLIWVFTVVCWGEGRALVVGVDGGRMGAG